MELSLHHRTSVLRFSPAVTGPGMERDRAFNFKLLVPPRISPGQVSAVKPQEITEDSGAFMQPVQSFNKPFEKESNMPFPAASMVAPSKSTRQDTAKKIAVMPMEKEEPTFRSSQLYSKLFEEAEKIKCWKTKMDMEIVQKDRKLQDNKRTIENQRKAIQELQFGNESLSMKLEEEMSKNTDLKNKINSTRNMCNLLKETFERSAEKMHLYESEREETQHLFMQNSENIQRMISAFEELRVQAETDRHDLLKLQEELKECDRIKEKFQTEFTNKHEEVISLHVKLNEKENELQDLLRTLQEARQSCDQLHEAAKQHQEMLEVSKQEQEVLLEKLQIAEQANKESEEYRKGLETTLTEKTEEYTKALVEKDNSLEELKKIGDEQAKKLQGILATAEELQVTLTFQVQRVKGLEEALGAVTEELKQKTSELEKLQMEETKVLQLTKRLESKNSEIQQLMHRTDILSVEKRFAEEALETLQKEQENLKEIAQMKESKLCEAEEQLAAALANERTSTEEIERLKRDTEQHKKEYEELRASFTELQLQKEALSLQAQGAAADIRKLEAHLKEGKESEKKIAQEMKRAEEEKQQLRHELEYLKATVEEHGRESETVNKRQEDSNKSLQNELAKKEKQIKALEVKMNTLKTKIETKTKAHEECLKENKNLKRHVATENDKCSQFEMEVSELRGELKAASLRYAEELETLRQAVETQRSSGAQLQEKVHKLQLTAAEAAKSKEETEMKCQHKISDMVALMDKHKNQYDKMFEEKDAELDEKRKREVEINAAKTSLELEMSELKIHNSDLKKQLENEIKEKENMKQEVASLNKKIKTLKEDCKHKMQRTLTPVASSRGIKDTASSKASSGKSRRAIFDFTNEQENESCESLSIERKVMVTPQLKVSESGTLKTSWSSGNKAVVTPRIKSYRIRTPPSPGKSVLLGRSTLELDPKSDSSEPNDSLSFSVQSGPFKRNLYPGGCGPLRQLGHLQKKFESPAEFPNPNPNPSVAFSLRARPSSLTLTLTLLWRSV
ncbi:synaptonemal complex protein 1 isoform X2 [Anguilla anguilla]|uniref:synaptonemal complex protein 1 isoform X2 n=1 Tax=Anguilla anguilla TaxID=7936 RepID=UPI0015AAADC2|nr:synaptonemal complex protein 1 isoform X2 [Anguilla anguilla]